MNPQEKALAYVRHMSSRHNLRGAKAHIVRLPRPQTAAERIGWKETPYIARLLDRQPA